MPGVTSVVAVLFMVVLPCNGVIVQVINLLLTPIDVMLVRPKTKQTTRLYTNNACYSRTTAPTPTAQVPTYMSVGGWLMSAPATLSPSQFIAV